MFKKKSHYTAEDYEIAKKMELTFDSMKRTIDILIAKINDMQKVIDEKNSKIEMLERLLFNIKD